MSPMRCQRKRLHRPTSRIAALTGALLVLIALPPSSGLAQSSATLKIIVPYPPGGGVDAMARRLAEQIGRNQGITTVIDNRPGGGTIIGTEAAARAAPDGNTVLMITNTFVVTPQLKSVSYDALTSFEPICNLVSTPTVLAVHVNSPYRTLADFVAAAKEKPAALTGATVPGTFLSASFEMLLRAAQIKLNIVPFNGTAPVIGALLGEHVDSALVDFPTAAELIKSGKLRGLATGSRARLEALPNVPTVDESGYRGYEADLWYGVFAPARIPRESAASLAEWFAASLRNADIRSNLLSRGLFPNGTCGAEFKEYLRTQYEKYGKVIRDANLKSE